MCNAPICADCERKYQGRSVCVNCLARLAQRTAARYRAETERVSYGGALFWGVTAAGATAFAWSQFAVMTDSRLAVAAVVLGGMVGYAVMWGAGEKRGHALQQIACTTALVGIVVGYFLVFLRCEVAAYSSLSGGQSDFMGAMYGFPGYLSELGFLDWLLLALGVMLAYWVPHARRVTGYLEDDSGV